MRVSAASSICPETGTKSHRKTGREHTIRKKSWGIILWTFEWIGTRVENML